MALEVGIVGLPNAGKSTLFNALSSQKIAQTSPVAFTTIDPHEAVVPVPDENLKKLKKLIKPQEVVPATIKFIDIAGLVKGAHKGKGLGNMFLGKVREVNLLVHVTRGFIDPQVPHQHQTHEPGTLEQALEDIEIVNLELQLAGINKRQIYILNANENQVSENLRNQFSTKISEKFQGPTILMSAKLEEELIDLDEKDRISYLKELKIEKPGLEILIKKAYKMLGLVTFYTIKGGEEISAWSLKEGENALSAAEKVHTDFAKNFIKAEVIPVDQLLKVKGWKKAKEKGLIKLQGKDYIVQDKDVIEFKVGSG